MKEPKNVALPSMSGDIALSSVSRRRFIKKTSKTALATVVAIHAFRGEGFAQTTGSSSGGKYLLTCNWIGNSTEAASDVKTKAEYGLPGTGFARIVITRAEQTPNPQTQPASTVVTINISLTAKLQTSPNAVTWTTIETQTLVGTLQVSTNGDNTNKEVPPTLAGYASGGGEVAGTYLAAGMQLVCALNGGSSTTLSVQFRAATKIGTVANWFNNEGYYVVAVAAGETWPAALEDDLLANFFLHFQYDIAPQVELEWWGN